MHVLKAGLMVAAALGATWAARDATDTFLGGARQPVMMRAEAAQAGATQEPAPPAAKAPPEIPQISHQEMEDELKRAKAEISGKGDAAGNEEFKPSKPLAADVAIALPSDI